MLDKNLFDAIMTLPSKNTTLLLKGISIIRKYASIELKTNEKGDVYYVADLNAIKNSDITEDELTEVRNGSWEMKDDKLIKFL